MAHLLAIQREPSPKTSNYDMSLHRLTTLVLFFFAGISANFAQSDTYSRIALSISDYTLSSAWLGVDHIHQQNDEVIVEVSERILKILDQESISYRILVHDLVTYYQEQNRSLESRSLNSGCEDYPETPSNFRLGSMGGYLTLEELEDELVKMHELFPNHITRPQPISDYNTFEGRPILWSSITGKGTNSTKKGVLYTALHHAREPLSMQQMVYFMWYMLENYNQDLRIRHILDNTVLYFIPCVNPDGYAYNARVSPDGGGMWRKNRRPFGKEYGVDLNRNYGFQWGYNSMGSSDDPSSELYRGPSAFSEPETQAVKWFCENHAIDAALNYHAFGDYLIYPWGYTSESNNHQKHFKSLARALSFEKRIMYGTSRETVLYSTNGDADDWMYGETNTKNRIYSMTPEVGPAAFGFWPRKNQIEMLCARELSQNLRLAMAPHGSILMVPTSNPVFYTPLIKHKFVLYPVTLDDGIVQSKITPLTDNIREFPESFYVFGVDNAEEYVMDITLKNGLSDGDIVQFVMTLDNGNVAVSDTFTYVYSEVRDEIDVLTQPTDIDNWVRSSHSGNGWGISTSDYYSAPSSITDSPKGLYTTATENFIVSSQRYYIPDEEEVYLTFKAKWDITFGKDYAQLSISTDGVRFTPLCGNLTTPHFQYDGTVSPVYTGVQNEWLTERISLNAYKGQEVYFKWNMVSESSDAREGIFVDDMKITYSQTLTSAGDDLVDWGDHEMYPNPVLNGLLNLKISEMPLHQGVIGYEIRNHLGQLMRKGAVAAGLHEVEIRNYAPGMYYLQLINEQGLRLQAQKFIVFPQ